MVYRLRFHINQHGRPMLVFGANVISGKIQFKMSQNHIKGKIDYAPVIQCMYIGTQTPENI